MTFIQVRFCLKSIPALKGLLFNNKLANLLPIINTFFYILYSDDISALYHEKILYLYYSCCFRVSKNNKHILCLYQENSVACWPWMDVCNNIRFADITRIAPLIPWLLFSVSMPPFIYGPFVIPALCSCVNVRSCDPALMSQSKAFQRVNYFSQLSFLFKKNYTNFVKMRSKKLLRLNNV